MDKKRMIATRIKAARKAKKITQKAFGAAMGIDQGQISRIEAGTTQLTPPMLVKVADFLDVSASYLMCEDDIKNPPSINTDGFETGLEELVQDSHVMSALLIQEEEIRVLSSLKPDSALSKDAYIQMLYVIRQGQV